jgi:ParB/RepB/Spo0J family partition protein
MAKKKKEIVLRDWKEFEVVDNARWIPIDLIVPNGYNPNDMDKDGYAQLVEEIRTVGFKKPIDVVPLEDGRFRIIDGEHRFNGAKAVGLDKIPCYLLFEEKFKDNDLQVFLTMRFNVLRGKTNPEKFAKIYEDFSKRYSSESLQKLMGFTDTDEWKKLTEGVMDVVNGLDIPKRAKVQFQEDLKGLKSVDDIAVLLETIFSQCGSDLQHNYISFGYGGKQVIYIACENEELYHTMTDIIEHCRAKNLMVDDFIYSLLGKFQATDADFVEVEDDAEVEGF